METNSLTKPSTLSQDPLLGQASLAEVSGSIPQKDSWRGLLEIVRQDIETEKKLPLSQRLRLRLWDYHLGLVQGWGKGILGKFHDWVTPFSGLYRSTPNEMLEDTKQAEELALDYLQEYHQSDWETRGKLTGEATIKTGFWLLEAYLFAKKLPQGILAAFRKF